MHNEWDFCNFYASMLFPPSCAPAVPNDSNPNGLLMVLEGPNSNFPVFLKKTAEFLVILQMVMKYAEFNGIFTFLMFPRAFRGARHLQTIGIPIGIFMFAAWGLPGRV